MELGEGAEGWVLPGVRTPFRHNPLQGYKFKFPVGKVFKYPTKTPVPQLTVLHLLLASAPFHVPPNFIPEAKGNSAAFIVAQITTQHSADRR